MMPGLYGLVDLYQPLNFAILEEMARQLRFGRVSVSERWLDASGVFGFGRESLGFFLPRGQPLEIKPGVWLLAEGEIAGCTTHEGTIRLLLEAFERQGVVGLGQINGGITTAIWEAPIRRLTLISDSLGLRPLFYTEQAGRLAFASEMKALFPLYWLERDLDEEALAEWLAFEAIGADRTLLQNVSRLPPGSLLIWEYGKSRIFRYEELIYREANPTWKEEDWIEAFTSGLFRALERRLKVLSGCVLPLSGGLDSRLLLAAVTKISGCNIPVVTYGLANSRDIVRSRHLARLVGLEHQVILLADNYPSCLAKMAVERSEGLLNVWDSHGISLSELDGSFRVLLLGNGPDIMLSTADSSYPPEIKALQDPLMAYFKHANDLFPIDEWDFWFEPWFVNSYRAVPRCRVEEVLESIPAESFADRLDTHHLRFYETNYLQGLSTIHPWFEYSEPYLDRDLVTLMLGVPRRLRFKRDLQKKVLVRLNPKLASVNGGPLAKKTWWDQQFDWLRRRFRWGLHRVRILQKAHLEPPSATFTDLHTLLRRQPNRQWIEEMLLNPRFFGRGWFKPEAVRQAVEEHMAGKVNHTRRLGAMLTLELFMRRFVEDGVGKEEVLK